MKKDFNNNATDKQRLNVNDAIKGVVAPAGSVSMKKDKRANDTADSFLGTLLVDCLLTGGIGQVFSQAASLNVPSWAPEMSIADVATVADELWMDRRDEQAKDGFKLGEHGAMKGTFNSCMTTPPFITLRDRLDDLASYRPKPTLDRNRNLDQPRPGL